MLKRIKNNYLFILELLFLLVLAILPFVYNNSIDRKSFSFMFPILVLIVISLFFYFFLKKKQKLKPEKIFLLIILIIGPIYLLLLPISQIPDEKTHAARIYEIASGHLVTNKYDNVISGRKLDSGINPIINDNEKYEEYYNKINIEEQNNNSLYVFNNTALYSFVCYIPQTLGVLIANIFTDKILIQLLFARLFNLLFYTLLMYYAIKLLPLKKELMFIVGLIPLSIQEAVSLAPDSLTISASALLISYIFYLRSSKIKNINTKHIVLISILSLIVSQCKIVYLPLCLLLFLIPSSKFKSLRNKIIVCLSIFTIVFVISIIWLKIAGAYLPEGAAGIDSSKQLHNIITNPIKYCLILISTFNYGLVDYLFEAFGGSLSLLNINITRIFILINIILFVVFALCNNKEKEEVSKYVKWFLGIIIIGIIVLICTSIYIQWTPVNLDLIIGIQGRYFIPLLFISGLLLYNKQINTKQSLFNRYFVLFIVMEQLCVLSNFFNNFI